MFNRLVILETKWKCAILAALFSTLFSSALFAAEWSSTTIYATPGTIVEYNGQAYKNHWWTQGDSPDGFADNPWHVWRPVENVTPEPDPTPDPTPTDIEDWDSGTIYHGGDQVAYNGQVY